MTTAASSTSAPPAEIALEWGHLEFYVANAKQAAYFFRHAFGFDQIAYAGPETGVRDRVSYVLEQGRLRIVVTAALAPEHPIAEHVARHGDGIKDVAFITPDARAAIRTTVERGARALGEALETHDEFGAVTTASIAVYGETTHTFVERGAYRGVHLPGYVAAPVAAGEPVAGLAAIDHVVANVGWNEMESWTQFYARTFGFTTLFEVDEDEIATDRTALHSKVMADARRELKFPINEPAEGAKRSQIEEYLDSYRGPGVQHVAIATHDIVATVRALRARGVEFQETVGTYFDRLPARVGAIDEEIAALRELGILVDRDDRGYMLQIFTKPLGDRPTLFFEIIQRKGSLSFGKGNFKELFISIELDQERRGAL